MFCLRNQDITDAKAFFYLFFMSNSGYNNNNEGETPADISLAKLNGGSVEFKLADCYQVKAK